MLVEELLEQSARCFPDKTALITEEERFTYLEIEQQANSLAHALVNAGIKRGDRVVIVLPNSVEAVLAIFAILKADAAFVELHYTTKSDKLAYVLNNCRASAIVIAASKLDSDNRWLGDTPYLRSAFVVNAQASHIDLVESSGKAAFSVDEIRRDSNDISAPPRKCIDIDLAALIYTSGSTGWPKGVMMTHLSILSASISIGSYLENRPDDVVVNVLPLAFGYGLQQLLVTFKFGATLLLLSSFAYHHAVLQRIVDEGVTCFALVPTISATLLQMDLSRYDLSRLRYITNAAAALPIDHIHRLRARLPHVKIYSMYGLTECTRVTYLPPDQIDFRPGSVGRGMPNQELYIVDPEGSRVGPGVVGELVVRGSHVMKGYWEMPGETQSRLRPGTLPGKKVLHSGDLFYADEEGYLFFVSRMDDIIKTRGEKVSPREVEDALYSLEGVAEAVALGVPDPVLGSAVKAVIVLKQGAVLSVQDVLRHCSGKLEDFMVPKFVEFHSSLPKTDSGKISRHAIAQAFKASD
jgi:long-chain acyl-CoA synthetase